ncbi:MAG: hypothetical protein J6Z17_05160 [Treponema sp.]|nr:hypothetical protein [Treponema sp.]
MLSNILFYVVSSSAVLVYCLGINRAALFSQSPRLIPVKFIKMILTVTPVCALSYLFTAKLLVRADLSELYPFVALLIFILISVFIESIVRITLRTTTADYALSYSFVLLSLAESSSIAECILIACISSAAFFLLIPFLVAIRKRSSADGKSFKDLFIVYIGIAVIMIITLAWNVSWLNPGAIK